MMKKILILLTSIMLALMLVGCGESSSETINVKEVEGIDVPAFEIKICGAKVSNNDLNDLKMYSIKTNTKNSQGTEHNYEYVGFKLSDLLDLVEVSKDSTKAQIICADGYEYTYEGSLSDDSVLIAVTKDGEYFKDGPWFAPCSSKTTGDYGQDLAKLEIEGITSPSATNVDVKTEETEEIAFPQDPVSEDKTDKINFADFAFKINGQVITNKDLEGLKIYRNTVVTKNSKDVVSQNKYSGYVLKAVLDKLGITGNKIKVIASDGYESEITEDMLNNELTIIAIEKDKEVGKDGTIWLAPCNEQESSKYAKEVVEIIVE